jgi:hypothetical protein
MVALKTKYGIITANRNFARGVGRIAPRAYHVIGEQTEKENLTVVVSGAQADEIFSFIYHSAQINRPRGGLMYMHSLQRSISYTLPDLPEEEST